MLQLTSFLRSEYPSEIDVWSVVGCFARICMDLENGREDTRTWRRSEWVPMVHLDIRPENSKIYFALSDMHEA